MLISPRLWTTSTVLSSTRWWCKQNIEVEITTAAVHWGCTRESLSGASTTTTSPRRQQQAQQFAVPTATHCQPISKSCPFLFVCYQAKYRHPQKLLQLPPFSSVKKHTQSSPQLWPLSDQRVPHFLFKLAFAKTTTRNALLIFSSTFTSAASFASKGDTSLPSRKTSS